MRMPVSSSVAQVRNLALVDVAGWLGVVAFSALVVIVFAPYAAAGFVGTDVLTSIETSRVRSVGDLVSLWLSPFGDGSMFVRTDAVIYRPVVAMLFALDYALWGMDPTGYHLTNTLLHLLASLATFAFLRSMGLHRVPALIGAGLVAFHPGMAGAVPVLSRRHDPTAVALLLGSLALLLRSLQHSTYLTRIASVVLFGLSLGAKETSFGALPLLPLIVAAAPSGRPTNLRGYVTTLAPFGVAAVVLFALRFIALGGIGGHRDVDLQPDAGRYRLVLDEYVTQLFWPFRSFYPQHTVEWAILGALALTALGLGIACLPRRERMLAALGVTWVAAFGLFIVVSQHKPGPWYMYYPLPGLALVIAALAQHAPRLLAMRRPRLVAPAALSLVGLVYLVGLVVRTPIPGSYAMWSAASAVESAFRAGAVACTAETPDGGTMEVNGAPYLLEQHEGDADLLSITWFQEFSVAAAVRLAHPERHISVVVWSYVSPKSIPNAVDVQCTDPPAARQLVAHYR